MKVHNIPMLPSANPEHLKLPVIAAAQKFYINCQRNKKILYLSCFYVKNHLHNY